MRERSRADGSFLRVYARVTATPAMIAIAPLFATSLVVGAIFFGPNGLRARAVVGFAVASRELRAAVAALVTSIGESARRGAGLLVASHDRHFARAIGARSVRLAAGKIGPVGG